MTPVALLVHGAGSCPATARLLLDAAVPYGVETVAVDARGGIEELVQVIDVAAEGRDVHLLAGISLGAHAAALWAARGGRAAALLLVMPAWIGRPDPIAALTAASAEDIERRGRDAVLAEIAAAAPDDWVVEELQRGWSTYGDEQLVAILRAAAASAGPTLTELAGIDVPTAVVALADDPLHPEAVARRWATAIRGARLATVARQAPLTDRGALGRAGGLALPSALPRAGFPSAPRLLVAYGTSPAHALLRAEAARFHRVQPTQIVLGHACPRCGSDTHGQPRLVPTATVRHPAFVSLGRAGDLSVVAVTDAGPVGVDVETEGAAEFAGFDDVVLHPGERAVAPADRTRVWVRKEALLKAHGLGLAVDPSDVMLDHDRLASWNSRHRPPGAVWLRDVPVPGHVVSVAVLPIPGLDVDHLAATVTPATT